MDMQYRWAFKNPAGQLVIHMDNTLAEQKHFDATLHLEEMALNKKTMGYVLRKYPIMSLKIVWGIYWQACKLWFKRMPFYSHPASVNSSNRSQP